MPEKTYIALTGNPASGKSTVAEYLHEEYGFTTVRVSSVIREYATQHDMPLECRNDYISAHLAMAAQHGEGYDIQRVFESDDDRICIDGIRIVRQVEELHKIGATVAALWCPIEQRFERAQQRADIKDKPTLAGFRADEAPEYQSSEPPYPSVMTVMQMADVHIDASRSENAIRAQIDSLLSL